MSGPVSENVSLKRNNVYFEDFSAGPFRATQLWHNIISHLQSHVDVGCRRRHLIKQYDVFTGNNAVDVVFDFLKQKETDLKREVSRENAVKVCQTMLDYQIFVPVSAKPNASFHFKDSSMYLYKFCNAKEAQFSHSKVSSAIRETPSKRSRSSSLSRPQVESSFLCKASDTNYTVISNPNGHNESSRGATEHSCANCRSSVHFKNSFEPFCTSKMFPPAPSCAHIDSRYTPQPVDSNTLSHTSWSKLRRTLSFIRHTKERTEGSNSACLPSDSSLYSGTMNKWGKCNANVNPMCHQQSREELCSIVSFPSVNVREVALSFLLMETDISFLESILEVPADLPDVTIENLGVVIQNRTPLSEVQNVCPTEQRRIANIPWIEAATACINSLPLGITHLWSLQACKVHCYRTVVEYYQQTGASLFPEAYFPFCTAVIKSVKSGKILKALKILQLLFLLMPCKRKEQLQKLLKFLDIVVRDIFVHIDKKVSNHEIVLRDFSCIVFSHPLMSFDCSSLFLEFLLLHVSEIFLIPHWLKQALQKGLVFCEQVSVEEYHQCCQFTTYKELHQLLAIIVANPSISARRKKYLLKKYEQLYPNIYSSYLVTNQK